MKIEDVDKLRFFLGFHDEIMDIRGSKRSSIFLEDREIMDKLEEVSELIDKEIIRI